MRVKRGNVARKRRKKILARAKGFRGSLSKLIRPAKQAVTKALSHSYRGRRQKKRDNRSIWIVQLNAAVREHDLSYSQLISGLKKGNVALDRKTLSTLAATDQAAFSQLVETAKAALGKN